MAAPGFEGSRLTQAFSTDATSFVVNLPATVFSGNLLILAAGSENPSQTQVPAGWTELANIVSGQGGIQIYTKLADGTEGGTTVTLTTAGAGGQLATIVDQINNFSGTIATDIDISAAQFAFPNTVDPNAVTASWGSDENLFIPYHGGGQSGLAVAWSAFSSSYGNTVQITTTDNGSAYIGSCARALTADTDDPGAWTGTGNGQGYTYTLVLKPGGVAPVGPPPTMFMKKTLGSNLIDGPMIR